jgi:hypothetical protein
VSRESRGKVGSIQGDLKDEWNDIDKSKSLDDSSLHHDNRSAILKLDVVSELNYS